MADTYLALSALGPDKKGLVAALTAYIAERRGNVEESRMAILGAEFGVLMLIRASADAAQKLKGDVAKLESETGLLLRMAVTKNPAEHRQSAMPYRLIADAADNEGIISRLTDVCTKQGINVVNLESESYPAPVTAVPLFRMNALIDVPQTVKVADLRAALQAIADQGGIDLELKAER